VNRRRHLATPHGTAGVLADVGRHTPLAGRQRIGRARRRRRLRARIMRWARCFGGITLVLGIGVGSATWLLTTPRLAVRSIQVEGVTRVSAEEVLATADLPLGTNMLRVDPGAIRARVETLPQIRNVEIIREFPGRVTILVEERRPFTLIHAGRLHWMDEEARLLGEEREAVSPPVPIISGLTEEELTSMRSAPGPKAQAAMTLVRTLMRSSSSLLAEISEIDMSRREGPVLYTVDGIEVRLGSEQWEERLARLEGVLDQLAIQDGKSGTITAVDLRFRDQVVLRNGGPR
jgi:cell division protein FtsQ